MRSVTRSAKVDDRVQVHIDMITYVASSENLARTCQEDLAGLSGLISRPASSARLGRSAR